MIVKSASRIIQELDARSFTVLGSPGADGLGPEALGAFHAGLTGAGGDFVVVLGDASPIGRDPYYRRVADFIDASSAKPVYVVRGNHDGPDYPEYFGIDNGAILSEEYLLVMLDNSQRRFSDEALTFLRETMALAGSGNVLVAFHVPPPNRFSGASMSAREWQRFEDAVGVWRSRISLLVCSHAHNGFEDEVDGLRLVVTGGAGARMHASDRLAGQAHHALEISPGAPGGPEVSARRLSWPGGVGREGSVPEPLAGMYAEWCRESVELTFRAEEAEEAGARNLARLYRAGSASSLRQARSLYGLAGRGEALARLAGEGAEAAKRSFDALLEDAGAASGAGRDIGESRYFICGSCGLLSSGSEAATYCPACGAPGHLMEESG